MKVFLKLTSVLGLIALLTPVFLTSGCAYLNKVIAKDSLNQGVIFYNQGRIRTAQEKFRSATERDPASPVAWLYLGATLVKDYKVLSDPEKTKVANEAIEKFKKALELSHGSCKVQDSANSYIASIYDDLQNMDEWRSWLLKRADGDCADKDIKVVTYYSVGQKYWDCAYTQTTRYQDHANKDPFAFRNMDYTEEAKKDKQKVEECTAKGLEYIEKVLKVDPEYPDAYFYKGLLIRERQKLTKEESKRRELDQLAQKLNDQGSTLQRKKEAAKQQQQQAPPSG